MLAILRKWFLHFEAGNLWSALKGWVSSLLYILPSSTKEEISQFLARNLPNIEKFFHAFVILS
jgi:hypothetical protein